MDMDAGMLIIEAVIRFWAGTPRLTNSASMDPEMVEKPEVMTRSVIDINFNRGRVSGAATHEVQILS